MKRFGTPPSPDAAAAPQGAKPIPLEINGRVFNVRGRMNGLKLLRVVKALDGGGSKSDENVGEVLWDFLEFAFLKAERVDAMLHLEESEPIIDFPELMEIVQWLVEQYTGNPTESPESSDPGSGKTGSTSSETPELAGATLENSTPTNSGQSE